MEHSDTILSLIFSSTEPNWILSGSRDQSLHIWNIEQHTQASDQPIQINTFEEEDETSSNSGSKKRHHKPRLNRLEREKKRTAKAEEVNGDHNERMISSTNSRMNECKKYCWTVNVLSLFFLSSKFFSISITLAIENRSRDYFW